MKRNEVNLISFTCPSFIRTRSKVVHQVQALCQVPAIAGLRRCASSKSRTSSKLSTRAKVLRQVQGRAPGPRRCTRVKSRSRSRRRSRSKAQHQVLGTAPGQRATPGQRVKCSWRLRVPSRGKAKGQPTPSSTSSCSRRALPAASPCP